MISEPRAGMERLPEMASKVTTLVCASGMEDPGRVADDATRRPEPEVPERARRRTFTAKYKLEVLAAYDAAPDGEKGAVARRDRQAEQIRHEGLNTKVRLFIRRSYGFHSAQAAPALVLLACGPVTLELPYHTGGHPHSRQ